MADAPIRLLLVVGETTGGIGRHVGLLAERLPAYGFAVTVAGPASALKLAGAPEGVARKEIPAGWPNRIWKVMRTADVTHAHGIRAGASACWGRRASRSRLVVTWHNAPLLGGVRGVAQRVAMRIAATGADVTLGASPDLTAAARAAGSRDARDTFVVAPPMGPPTRSRAEVRATLGVGERPVVLAIGRLQAQKRLDVLVDAATGWADRADRPIVVIAGSGPDEDALRAQARARRAAVVFLGARDDVPDLLAAADVVALPSAWEARALVAQEALRAGVPLVTTPVGGLPDLLGNAGLVFPVGDAARLRDALLHVTTTPSLATAVAAAGLEQAASWPTLDASIADLASTYRALHETR